jgi:hypothetical protein
MHNTDHQGASLGFSKRSACYWTVAVATSTHKGGKGPYIVGIQLSYGHTTTVPSISTAIIKAEERFFSLISEGDKEFGLSMLVSAGVR